MAVFRVLTGCTNMRRSFTIALPTNVLDAGWRVRWIKWFCYKDILYKSNLPWLYV